MDEFLTDQQRAEQAKTWLRENGGFMVVGLILGLGALFGWNSWQDYRDARAEQASVVYDNLVRASGDGRIGEAETLLTELYDSYSGTPYMTQGRLLLARLHMDRNEFDEASDYLVRIIDDSGDDALVSVARLRLARIRHHQRRYDDALAALEPGQLDSAFEPRFHEVRGDILLAQGNTDGARAEYEAALTSDDQGLIDRGYVRNKLDSIGAGE